MTSDNQQPSDYKCSMCGEPNDYSLGVYVCPDCEDNQQPMSVDEIFATLKVEHRWSRPRPFTEDRQLHVIVGKKAAIAQINQLIREAVAKERKICVATMNLMMENVESNLLKSKEKK